MEKMEENKKVTEETTEIAEKAAEVTKEIEKKENGTLLYYIKAIRDNITIYL